MTNQYPNQQQETEKLTYALFLNSIGIDEAEVARLDDDATGNQAEVGEKKKKRWTAAKKKESRDKLALDLTLNTDETLSLNDLIGAMLPEGVALPDELPVIKFSDLKITANAQTGAFELNGKSAISYELPLGIPGLAIHETTLNLKRAKKEEGEAGPEKGEGGLVYSCTIQVCGKAPVPVVNGLIFNSINFTFELTEESGWSLTGDVGIQLLEAEYNLGAGLEIGEGSRGIALQASREAETPLLKLGTLASLDVSSVTFNIKKALNDNAEDNAEAAKNSAYSWSLEAAGSLALHLANDSDYCIRGKLGLNQGGNTTAFLFEATDGAIAIPMHIPQHQIDLHVGLEHIDITAKDGSSGTLDWSLTVATKAWLTGLPKVLQDLLADAAVGQMVISGDGLRLTVDRILAPVEILLPETQFGTVSLAPGKAAIDASNLALTLNSDELMVSLDVGAALPADLNKMFGTQSDGSPSIRFFNTYQSGNNDSIIKLRLAIDAKKGFTIELLTSPIAAIAFEQKDGDTWCNADLGEFGAAGFRVPKFSYDGYNFSATGGFSQVRPFQIPLKPIKELLEKNGLKDAGGRLPNSVRLVDLNMIDSQGRLQVDNFVKTLQAATGIALPSDIVAMLEKIKDQINQLPTDFLRYLRFELPKSFTFDISITVDGGAKIKVSTEDGTPIRILLPAGLMCENLVGLELRSFTFGEIFSGTLFLLSIDVRLDIFDLVTLASTLIPRTALLGLPDPHELHRRLIIKDLLMLIVYQTVVPIPIPIFYKELGVDYLGLEGTRLESHWYFPAPEFNLGEGLDTLKALSRFVTEPDYLLDTGEASVGPKGLVLHLPFDEAESATTFADQSGHGIAIAGDVTTCPKAGFAGKIGKAVKFDGVNDCLSLPHRDAFRSPQFSLSVWFQWDQLGTANIGFLAGKGVERCEIHTGEGNGLRFIPAGHPTTTVDAPNFIQPGWNHVVVTYTGSEACVYRNGKLFASKTDISGGADLASDTAAFSIGRRSDGGYYFAGLIDDLRVYNRALSAEEIAELFALPATVKAVVPRKMDLSYTIGANYIQLPEYFGKDLVLGSKENILTISAYRSLALMLNAAKTLSLNEIIHAVPLEKRVGKLDISFFGIESNVAWLITTPDEFRQVGYSQLPLPSTEVESTLQVLPPSVQPNERGLVVFLKGVWNVFNTARLNACFGLVGSSQGFATGLRINGAISDLISINMAGTLIVNTDPKVPDGLMLTGHSHLSVLNDEVFTGNLKLSNTKGLTVAGRLNLFPRTPGVNVLGELSGRINQDELNIFGDVSVTLGNYWALAEAKAEIRHTGINIRGKWLDQSLDFAVEPDGDAIQLLATISPISLGDLFILTGINGALQPIAMVRVGESQGPRVYINGEVSILGIRSATEVHFSETGFCFETSGKIFNLFACSLKAKASSLYIEGGFRVQGVFQNDFLSSLKKEVSKIITADTDAVVKGLSDAEVAVRNAKVEVDKINGEIDRLRKTITGERADAQNKLKYAQDEVDRAQHEVNKIQDEINATKKYYNSLPKIDLPWKANQTREAGWFAAKQAALYSALGIATAALQAAKLVLEGIKQLAKVTPIELDSRMSTRIAAHEIATAALTVAGQVLNKAGAGARAVSSVEQFVIEHGSDVLLQIRSVSFDTDLSAIANNTIPLQLDIEFMRQSRRLSLDYNFSNPIASAKSVAKALLSA